MCRHRAQSDDVDHLSYRFMLSISDSSGEEEKNRAKPYTFPSRTAWHYPRLIGLQLPEPKPSQHLANTSLSLSVSSINIHLILPIRRVKQPTVSIAILYLTGRCHPFLASSRRLESPICELVEEERKLICLRLPASKLAPTRLCCYP